MLLGDKKKMAAAIVGEMPAKREEAKADFPSALKSMAGDIINALQVQDSEMLAKALSNFIVMCGKSEEYEEG